MASRFGIVVLAFLGIVAAGVEALRLMNRWLAEHEEPCPEVGRVHNGATFHFDGGCR